VALKYTDKHPRGHHQQQTGKDLFEFIHRQAVGQTHSYWCGENTGDDQSAQCREIHIAEGVLGKIYGGQAVINIADRPGNSYGKANGC
jgi:hypothetical protein